MKKKITKNIAVLSFTAAICVTGFTLSQNNEYKKFLEMNKRALASEGQVQFGEWELWGRCSYAIIECSYTCTNCQTELTAGVNGRSFDMIGNCPICGEEPTNN